MIIALFAVDQTGAIGYKGGMPWPPVKEDFKWFKTTTQNQVVVMGRKTWESPDMPKPLPNRINVVVTRQDLQYNNVEVINNNICTKIQDLASKYPDKDIYIIGGADLLIQTKSIIDRVYITKIPGSYVHDVKINLDEFLEGFILYNINDLHTCKVEEYQHETIS